MRFPFGIEKLKNMVVLIPAGLFVYFGVEISMEAVTKFIHYSHLEHDLDISPVSLGVKKTNSIFFYSYISLA